MIEAIALYVENCLTCLQVKAEHQKLSKMFQPLEIPIWKWEVITMDFEIRLHKTPKRNDASRVIVDGWIKLALFLTIRKIFNLERLAQLYVDEIVSKHGVPLFIVSDLDSRFTSHFWQSFQRAIGTKLDMSTVYHPQTDGQSERTIRTLEDMPRVCITKIGGNWDVRLPLIESSYNNKYYSNLKAAPFKAMYGNKHRTPVC
jgi:hypothetical protein